MLVDFLHEHYLEDYSLDDLARIANYSPYRFIAVFKTETGKSSP
ncbi:helix-turn-helix transcriptional regulator [Desulforudis sp. 1088]